MLLPSPLLAHMVLLHAGALRMHAFAMITVVVMGNTIHGVAVLRANTIQEVGDEMTMAMFYTWDCCS